MVRRRNTEEALIVNPALSLTLDYKARVRGQPVVYLHFPPLKHHEWAHVFGALLQHPEWLSDARRIPREYRDALRAIGVLIPKSAIPPAATFSSALCDNDLLATISDHAKRTIGERLKLSNLRVNPDIYVQPGEQRPDGPRRRRIPPVRSFPTAKPLIWVRSPISGFMAPYESTKSDILEIKRLLASPTKTIAALSPERARRLVLSDILIPKNVTPRKAHRTLQALARFYKRERYVVLRNIIPPYFIAAIRKYFRALREGGYMMLDQHTVKGKRLVLYNDEVAQFAARQMSAIVSAVTGEEAMSAFTFVVTYLSGSRLGKHRDRPQCVWNISFLVDCNSEESDWPLFLEIGGKKREATLQIGDGVLYSGYDTPHWRNTIPKGRTETVITCHFVPADYPGQLEIDRYEQH